MAEAAGRAGLREALAEARLLQAGLSTDASAARAWAEEALASATRQGLGELKRQALGLTMHFSRRR